MPRRGTEEGLVFLQDKQAFKFKVPQPMMVTATDRNGCKWQLHSGMIDGDERNYGLFDNGKLIAHIELMNPEMDGDCVTPFWVIGRIGVETAFQGQGIGPALAEAVCRLHGAPLSSDLNQAAGGAAMWDRLIRANPGQIELHDANGGREVVDVVNGRLVPDPWRHPDKRLVRRF